MSAQKSVTSTSSQIAYAFRCEADGLERESWLTILISESVLKLTKFYVERFVIRHSIGSIVFLHLAAEVVHEEGEPAIGDGECCYNHGSLYVKGVIVFASRMFVSEPSLCISVYLNAPSKVLRPIGSRCASRSSLLRLMRIRLVSLQGLSANSFRTSNEGKCNKSKNF